jgi:hypothetical protein
VEWIAPHEIDLAIVSAPLQGMELRSACRVHDIATKTGAAVFAVGNPASAGKAIMAGNANSHGNAISSGNAISAANADSTDNADSAGDANTAANANSAKWTHTTGTLMQVREQRKDGYDFQVLQSQLALGPGYSGGGLYDESGRLLGIHSMASVPIGDPRVAGGIGLSTSLTTLVALAPERFGLQTDSTDNCAGREENAGK